MSMMAQEMEMRAQMRMQFSMIKGCFSDCVTSFSAAELSGGEKTCITNCAKREVGQMQTMAQL